MQSLERYCKTHHVKTHFFIDALSTWFCEGCLDDGRYAPIVKTEFNIQRHKERYSHRNSDESFLSDVIFIGDDNLDD